MIWLEAMAFQLVNALPSKDILETLLIWRFMSVAEGIVEHPIL